MRIVVAPDSFKGSLTSLVASSMIEQAILDIDPNIVVQTKPMADGGEGTLDALLDTASGERIPITCTGALGHPIETFYGIINNTTAVIEIASINGLIQVPEDKRNPDYTTSYGVGEVIADALDRGCTSLMIGIGGSATNDGGLGMLQALGLKAYDMHGHVLGMYGKDLKHMHHLDISGLDDRLTKVEVKIASDVDNPLCGENGATFVYGPQKGVSIEQRTIYDQALERYSNQLESKVGTTYKQKKGAGAAGGIGFALMALGAQMTSGAQLVAEKNQLEEAIRSADIVITGEGQSDEQTLYGKAPGHIAELAKEYNIPVILLSGSISDEMATLSDSFAGCFSIVSKPMSLEECMENASVLLAEQTRQIIRLLHVGKCL